jgi:hypothetical protein
VSGAVVQREDLGVKAEVSRHCQPLRCRVAGEQSSLYPEGGLGPGEPEGGQLRTARLKNTKNPDYSHDSSVGGPGEPEVNRTPDLDEGLRNVGSAFAALHDQVLQIQQRQRRRSRHAWLMRNQVTTMGVTWRLCGTQMEGGSTSNVLPVIIALNRDDARGRMSRRVT